MRMWMVDSKILCRKHLLGEHFEIEKHRHCFVKKHNMSKRVYLNQIVPLRMEERHNELVREMLRRGYKHNSPYKQPDVSYLGFEVLLCPFDYKSALEDLLNRCPECKKRFESVVL